MVRSVPTKVPEGGWGWVVCLASCWTNGTVFGIINSFGVLYVVMLNLDGADAFKTSWIGSVCAGLTFFMSPFASIITDKLGCRPAAVIGGVLALAGVLTSSFATRIEHMYITYGFAMGLGFAIAYQPSLYILGVYFQKRLGVANGLVTFGSAIFTIVLPIGMKEILTNFGLGPCLWFQSAIVFVMLVGGLTFRPRPEVVQRLDLKEDYTNVANDDDNSDDLQSGSRCCGGRLSRCKNPCANVFDKSIWKERNYRVWAIGIPLGMFGYFVPFFHLVKHVNDTLPDARSEILIMCLGATSGIGRLISGFLSDHPRINPIYIQQVSFLVIGVSTTLMPVMRNFIGLCVLILVMGIFDGAFVSMIGPIAFNLVGPSRASQAIGCLLGLMSIPMTVGPPVAGIIYDFMHSYDVAFICAGIPPIVGACILFLIRPTPRDDGEEKDAEENSVDEKERALMIPRETTGSMAEKEMEAAADDHGRRRSFKKDNSLSENGGRIIMENDVPHSKDHHGNGVLANAYGLHGNEYPYGDYNRNQSNPSDRYRNERLPNGHHRMNGHANGHVDNNSAHVIYSDEIQVETTV